MFAFSCVSADVVSDPYGFPIFSVSVSDVKFNNFTLFFSCGDRVNSSAIALSCLAVSTRSVHTLCTVTVNHCPVTFPFSYHLSPALILLYNVLCLVTVYRNNDISTLLLLHSKHLNSFARANCVDSTDPPSTSLVWI